MANPQPDKFSRLSNELLEIIIMSDFTKLQYSLLMLIWRLSWGCQKKTAYIPKLSYFDVCGVNLRIARKELEKLEESKVITRIDSYYAIQKNYDLWEIGNNKLFNIEEEIMKKLLSLNLSSEDPTSENRNFNEEELPKIGTEDFRKSEPITSENRNFDVPKIGSPVVEKLDNHAKIRPLKESIKENNKKMPKEKKKPDSRIKEISSYYEMIYQEKFKIKPIMSYGKDCKLLKYMIAIIDSDLQDSIKAKEEMKKIIDIYLNMNDKFVIESGFSIGVFKCKFNLLRIEYRKQQDQEVIDVGQYDNLFN